jgi:hypothetical protein
MSDPPRFLSANRESLGGRLLGSARDDDPPADAREKAFAALGVGIGATLVTGEAGALATAAQQVAGASISAAGEAGTAAAAAKGASLVASSVGFGLAKWASIGAAVGVLGLGTVEVVRERSIGAPAVQSAVQSVAPVGMAAAAPELSPRKVAQLNAPPSEAPALDPPVMVEPLAPSALPRAARVPATSRLSERSANHPSDEAPVELAEEVALLDQVREAMSAQNPDRALSLLQAYQAKFPSKTLLLEAKLLKIEALASKGDQARAVPLAEAFLLEHPVSAHASRVRSLLASMKRVGP